MHGSVCIEQDDAKCISQRNRYSTGIGQKRQKKKEKDYDIRRIGKESKGYEYYNRDLIVTTDAKTLIKIAEGKTGIEAAYLTGKIKAQGNLGKGLLLKELAPKKASKAKK